MNAGVSQCSPVRIEEVRPRGGEMIGHAVMSANSWRRSVSMIAWPGFGSPRST